jgi:hypothetical protein
MIISLYPYCVYENDVFLPEKKVRLGFEYSDHISKYFFCVASYDQNEQNEKCPPFRDRFSRVFGFKPGLENYKALPYKRQSSVCQLDEQDSSLRTNSFGFPFSDKHESLCEIKAFYLGCKKQYVVIARRCSDTNDDGYEKVLLVCSRYSDALPLLRDPYYVKLRSLLGHGFKACNSWYPYVWVEHMDSPICLLSEITSYVYAHSLGYDWCRYFLRLLRDGYVGKFDFYAAFGFALADIENQFSNIIHYSV